MSVTTLDTWLADGAVLATLHLPRAAASVGVVICPPIGYDYTVAYRSIRHLADRVAASGLAVIRYDHPGFGDSTESLTADALERGAALAGQALRDVGCASIVYLGLGSGALVASLAAAEDPAPAGLVLWDPVASGRQWMRHRRSIYSLSLGSLAEEAPEGLIEVAGAEMPEGFAQHIEALTYDQSVVSRVPTLVAVRAGAGAVVPRSLRSVQDHIDVLEVTGHERVLDVSSIDSGILGESVEVVVDWLASHFATNCTTILTPLATAAHLIRFTDHGSAVEERLRRIGPHGLFAIETRPAGGSEELPAVVLHNGSAEHRTGATRHQVILARRLAARGIRAVRVDRRGTGESSEVCTREAKMLYAEEWLEDGAEVLADLALPRAKVGIVGMCTGSWVGLVSAPDRAAFVMAFSVKDHRVLPLPHRAATPPGGSVVVGATGPALRDRVVAVAKRRAPYWLMLALAMRGVVQFAEPGLRRVLASGSDVTLLLCPDDTEIFRAHGGEKAVRRLRRLPGRLTVIDHPAGDHALFSPGIRARAIDEAVSMAERFFHPAGR